MSEDRKKIIFSAIQPTGTFTLGNYLGAVRNWSPLQDEYNCIYAIADLHAITVKQEPKLLRQHSLEAYALLLACGINPEKSVFFIQSHVRTHTELAWALACSTQFGELSRMTQFKDKSLKNVNFTSGLLTYPVLMAADILIYDIDYVPVGKDQKQHVELARDIAERFNKKYGQTFNIPTAMIPENVKLIMDLVDPTKKMSKSADNKKGSIFLLDDVEVTRKKIMGATTDSEMIIKYDMENKPGISNLINIYTSLNGKSISEVEQEFEGKNYGEFKKCVADLVVTKILEIQEKYNKYINSEEIDKILDEGRDFTRKIAADKFKDMKHKMGLGRD